ncbi:MAG: nucleotidyltransferase family protein [Bacteroidaceae bacterium]|nr:nucleotidyltransferase family protein [Bacteroidaceae bacterium]MBR5963372.1 nucleotidyltransferase family protein [Bacteroidaceae bacterium]
MKNIIIAAGYATRLYPLTENFPKPLLQIGGSTILGRLIEDVDTFPEIDEHIIISNHKFVSHFADWAKDTATRCPIRIIDDGTSTNETRLGAVRDLLLAISQLDNDEDILVMAADNILPFSLRGFIDAFKEKKTSMIMCHNEPSIKALQRTGVIRVDDDWRVLEMQEKPEVPCSHWAVPPFYIYTSADMPLIRTCLEHGCGFDAPGNLAHFLVDNSVLHAWQMPAARFDIGSLDSYEEAQRIFG